MKNRFIWLALSFLLVAAMLLTSCSTSTSSKTTSTTTVNSTLTTTKTTTGTTAVTQSTTTATTTAVSGNWWDKLGEPEYGGSLTISLSTDVQSWDDYDPNGLTEINQAYQDTLTADDWTLDPSVFAFQLNFRPSTYEVGNLGESWEFTDPNTYVVHLKHGVLWQNIPPVNGREFVADDVAFHYDRLLGLGHGFTTPSPYQSTNTTYINLISVTVDGNYTVVFKWKNESEESITEKLQGGSSDENFEAPEVIKQWGDQRDWHHAIGTGPFILTDFVSGSAVTLVRNPNYFAHDERHTQNKLPYIDRLNMLIITNQPTAIAALRTAKLDVLDAISLTDANNVKNSNSEILQITYPSANTPTLDPRVDVKPFSDIRVRQAMQMAMNLQDITDSYYQDTCPPYPSTMTSQYMTGWNYPYQQWTQDLKDQYAYNVPGAKALLSAAGYSTGFDTNVVASTASDLTLLQIVQSYLAQVNINMSIRTMDPAAWISFVRAHKHDQLAYGGNSSGFSFPPLFGFNRWATNATFSWANVSDPAWDNLRSRALAAPTTAETQALLVEANKYMVDKHWVISLVTPNYFALYQPWLKGFNAQNFSISGGGASGSPLFVGFYAARFWIDTSLKKSMGH